MKFEKLIRQYFFIETKSNKHFIVKYHHNDVVFIIYKFQKIFRVSYVLGKSRPRKKIYSILKMRSIFNKGSLFFCYYQCNNNPY